MNYPPSYAGQYPPQYLQQHPPRHHAPPQQFLYNNANSAPPPYQYGKPLVHHQAMIPPYPAYTEQYNGQPQQQQHGQPPRPPPQPQSQPHFQPQPQYVNPVDLFQQAPLPTPPRPHVHGLPQMDGQSPVSGPGSSRPPAPTTPSTKPQSPYYNGTNSNQSTASQPSQPVTNPPQVQQQTTPVAPTPPPRPAPQVLIPALSPEVQQKLQPQVPKKQAQRRPKQPSVTPASKPAKPSIDYQILLLALADEYLNAAQSTGTMVALQRREMDLEEYYKLVATGLGCLEAVLKVRNYVISAT